MIEVTDGRRPAWLDEAEKPAPGGDEVKCSHGWGERCAASRGRRCTCKCGGRNHGNQEALGRELEAAGKLTDRRIFEQRDIEERAIMTCAPLDGGFTFDRVPTGERSIGGQPITRTEVRFDGELFEQYWRVHSPTGFEWGYGGSGPADLALNILGRFVVAPEAWRLHQRFKHHFIASLRETGGAFSAIAVRRWIEQTWRDEDRKAAEREAGAGAA